MSKSKKTTGPRLVRAGALSPAALEHLQMIRVRGSRQMTNKKAEQNRRAARRSVVARDE